ncbi:hypothetical protein GRC12_25250 [Streptomyces griseorubiginosus]|nr:hypothetical protein [Streptomyces griseorubiginosus]
MLSEVGRPEEALTAAAEAVEIYRRLTADSRLHTRPASLTVQPRRRLSGNGRSGAGNPVVRTHTGGQRAGAGCRPPRHPALTEQPRRRLRAGGTNR